MSQPKNRQPKPGPIKPDTPLYRWLQMIAQEIAKDLENKKPANSK